MYVCNLHVFFQKLSLNGSADYMRNLMTEKILFLVFSTCGGAVALLGTMKRLHAHSERKC